MADNREDNGLGGLGDILKGVGKLIGSVADFADKDSFRKHISGELCKNRSTGGLSSRYDFSVKLGLDRENVAGLNPAPVYCIPQAGVFNEENQLTVILELSGADKDTLSYRIDGCTLVIEASGSDVSYRKEINISDFHVPMANITVTEDNGIFKLVLKAGDVDSEQE